MKGEDWIEVKSELMKWKVDFKVLNRMLHREKKIGKNETDIERYGRKSKKWSNMHLITVPRV